LLQLNPEKRWTAQEALKCNYFSHEPKPAPLGEGFDIFEFRFGHFPRSFELDFRKPEHGLEEFYEKEPDNLDRNRYRDRSRERDRTRDKMRRKTYSGPDRK
jgi:hypothetical protein